MYADVNRVTHALDPQGDSGLSLPSHMIPRRQRTLFLVDNLDADAPSSLDAALDKPSTLADSAPSTFRRDLDKILAIRSVVRICGKGS